MERGKLSLTPVPISEEDRHLTTFITPWDRYRYKTASQGYIASGDAYTRRYDEIVADIPNKTKCVDDVLLWADSIEESFFQTAQWLDICNDMVSHLILKSTYLVKM